jgi:hypothetical protein
MTMRFSQSSRRPCRMPAPARAKRSSFHGVPDRQWVVLTMPLSSRSRGRDCGRVHYERAKYASTTEIARHLGLSDPHVRRLLRFAYLAPDIVETIVEGRQPRSLTVKLLLRGIPLAWSDQRTVFGFTAQNLQDERAAGWPHSYPADRTIAWEAR